MPIDGLGVNVVGGSVRHIAAGIIRNNRDVITYLLILWIARLRIKRIADRDVRRKGGATVSAPRIK